MLLSRRAALTGALLLVPAVARAQTPSKNANAALAELERKSGGQLGVAMLNLASGQHAGHRQDERFLLCSTFKAHAAAFVLARVDRKEEKLDRRIVFTKKDIVSWSPGTEANVGGKGMTVAELCKATVTLSDNTAANLLLRSFGGPAALTAYLRSIGDKVTRLDRYEPALNSHDGPSDMRDTTSAAATVETLRTLLFGEALSKSSRAQLAAWLIANKTGDKRLRAGFPDGWLVGDKTGTSGRGEANDIGVAWPKAGGAVIAAAYYRQPAGTAAARDAVLAEVGRIAARL
jgi:beta-lactamase class A